MRFILAAYLICLSFLSFGSSFVATDKKWRRDNIVLFSSNQDDPVSVVSRKTNRANEADFLGQETRVSVEVRVKIDLTTDN